LQSTKEEFKQSGPSRCQGCHQGCNLPKRNLNEETLEKSAGVKEVAIYQRGI